MSDGFEIRLKLEDHTQYSQLAHALGKALDWSGAELDDPSPYAQTMLDLLKQMGEQYERVIANRGDATEAP